MLIKIDSGKNGPDQAPSDVVDLLLDCHERIRLFIELACRLSQIDTVSNDEVCDAAERIVRYFSESLPLHVADEEETVVARLTGRDPELDAAIDGMQQEHVDHRSDLDSLLGNCRILTRSPERLPELRKSLSNAALSLRHQFVRHLEQEEKNIFPAIRTLLTADERKVMMNELRDRRSTC